MSKTPKSRQGKTIAQLHDEAMEVYTYALLFAQPEGQDAIDSFRQAMQLEKQAAALLAPKLDLEPTRAAIHKSAAVMALRCKEYREAERLIGAALAGNPHFEMLEELRSLLEVVHFESHLQTRGIFLAKNEFQLSLTGAAVGDGVAESEELVGRLSATEKIVRRTVERKLGLPFQEAGKYDRGVARKFPIFVTPPRKGSFALTVRVGLPAQQLVLPGMEDTPAPSAEETIQEIVDCFIAINHEGDDLLEQRIPDADYRRNFRALARQIAPDGKRIKMVGLTGSRPDEGSRVAVNRTKAEISRRAETELPQGEVNIIGELLFANSTSRTNSIKVVDDHGEKHRFVVPNGMMSDVVKPLWATRVRALGVRKGRTKVDLLDIDSALDEVSS